MSGETYWVHSDLLQRNVSDYQLEWYPDRLLVTIGTLMIDGSFVTSTYQLLQAMQLSEARRLFLRLTASIDPKRNTFKRLNELGFELLRQTNRPPRN